MQAPEAFHQGLTSLELELESEELEKLTQFLSIMLETNQRFNLTAIKEPSEAWMRHILDSLSLIPFLLDEDRHILDMGTGGGFPGIPLAITQPHRQFTLVDATGKKVNYLTEAAATLGLENVTCLQERAELMGQQEAHRERYDVVTARAVGRMPTLLEYTVPLAKVHGRVLAMKGIRAEEELRDSGDALMLLGCGEVEVYETMPGLDDEAVVVIVEKLSSTEAEYPRQNGLPKSKPL